jgi:hypothetical protein
MCLTGNHERTVSVPYGGTDKAVQGVQQKSVGFIKLNKVFPIAHLRPIRAWRKIPFAHVGRVGLNRVLELAVVMCFDQGTLH